MSGNPSLGMSRIVGWSAFPKEARATPEIHRRGETYPSGASLIVVREGTHHQCWRTSGADLIRSAVHGCADDRGGAPSGGAASREVAVDYVQFVPRRRDRGPTRARSHEPCQPHLSASALAPGESTSVESRKGGTSQSGRRRLRARGPPSQHGGSPPGSAELSKAAIPRRAQPLGSRSPGCSMGTPSEPLGPATALQASVSRTSDRETDGVVSGWRLSRGGRYPPTLTASGSSLVTRSAKCPPASRTRGDLAEATGAPVVGLNDGGGACAERPSSRRPTSPPCLPMTRTPASTRSAPCSRSCRGGLSSTPVKRRVMPVGGR